MTLVNRGNSDDGFGSRVDRIRMDRAKELPSGSWDVIYDQVCYDAPQARAAVKAFDGRVGHYIFTSSMSVYGPGADLTEAAFDPFSHRWKADVRTEDDYAEGKRQAEAIFFQNAKFPLTAVRFPIVLGPDDYTKRLHFHIEHIREGKELMFPNLDAKLSFVHAGDAARFLAWLGEHGAMGPVNCSSPDAIRLRDLIAMIEKQVGKQARISEGDNSPFGIKDDWTMSVSKLGAAGFHPWSLPSWLEPLIHEIASEATSESL